MSDKTRQIEIFSADCMVCREALMQIEEASCSSCDIRVLNMSEVDVQRRAMALGVKSVPAVAVDGVLADCCSGRGVDMGALQAAGLGQPMS